MNCLTIFSSNFGLLQPAGKFGHYTIAVALFIALNGTSTSTRVVVSQLQKQLAAPLSNLTCMQATPI